MTGNSTKKIFFKFLPFWFFILFFKISASLHYTLMAPLGESIFPIWLVGIFVGSAAFIQLLLDVPAGKLLDKFGYRKLITISNLFFLLSASFLLLPFSKITFLGTLFFSIFGWLFITPGINAYLLSQASKGSGGRVMSFNDVFSSTGVVLGSFGLTYVLALGYKFMSIILMIPLLISLLALLFSPKDKVKIHEVKHEVENKHFYIRRKYIYELLQIMKKLNPASTMLLLVGLASSIFYAVIWFVIPLEIANGVSDIPSFALGIFDFSIVIFGFLLGKVADKVNRRRAVFWGLATYSFFGLILGFNLNLLFILFGFLATTGEELANLSLWSWLHSLDKDHAHDGLVAGIITFAQDLGWTIGPILSGLLYVYIGPTYVICLAGVILFCVWSVYEFIFNTKNRENSLGTAFVPRKPHFRKHKA